MTLLSNDSKQIAAKSVFDINSKKKKFFFFGIFGTWHGLIDLRIFGPWEEKKLFIWKLQEYVTVLIDDQRIICSRNSSWLDITRSRLTDCVSRHGAFKTRYFLKYVNDHWPSGILIVINEYVTFLELVFLTYFYPMLVLFFFHVYTQYYNNKKSAFFFLFSFLCCSLCFQVTSFFVNRVFQENKMDGFFFLEEGQ